MTAFVRIAGLPADPLAAAARFYDRDLAMIRRAAGAEPVCVVFGPADHTHKAWRLAAVQSLAREIAPTRINAVVGDDEGAIAATARYLDTAEGVTGQLLHLDGAGAGELV